VPVIITTVVATYVAKKILDQFIVDQGYGRIKKLFFPRNDYHSELCNIIEEAASEHEKLYPNTTSHVEIPFYQSQQLFELLNQHILFHPVVSVDTLLLEFKNHPNILPIRKDELLDFYDRFCKKINSSKNLKKLHIQESYKTKIFEIGDSIYQLRLMLESIDKKLTLSLNGDWLEEKSRSAIVDLDKRYTPELNLKLDVAKLFDGLGKTARFEKEIYEFFDRLLIKGRKLKAHDGVREHYSVIKDVLKKIEKSFLTCEFNGCSKIPISQFLELLRQCIAESKHIDNYYSKLRKDYSGKGEYFTFDSEYYSSLRDVREFDHECQSLDNYLNSTTVRLANNPFLILEGEAGIGKSHLLADIVSTRIEEGNGSVFLLGQHFITEESPWTQMFKCLQINSTSTNFLDQLNLYGKSSGTRVILFIDAINEGCGNTFWTKYINSFVDEIRKFEWLGLVLSLRSSYKKSILSNNQIERNNFELHKHVGFQSFEVEAINLFFDIYNIERPRIPFLNSEFRNPLFLKLFCEGMSKKGLKVVPKGLKGISSILEFYISGIDEKLSSVSYYNYDISLNLVKNSINALIKSQIKSDTHYLPYKVAFEIVENEVSPFLNQKGFIDGLISEGLLAKNIFRQEDDTSVDCVYLAFERFDDHLTASYLLIGIKDVRQEVLEGGTLFSYIENSYALYRNQGLIEALSIQIPEMFGIELHELIHNEDDESPIVNAFIKSMIWRKAETINTGKLRDYINETVLKYYSSYDFFFETLTSISADVDHPYNAMYLHSCLHKMTLAERDQHWTTLLKYKFSEDSSFRLLIDWAWHDSDKSYISDESIKLTAITLSWLLTSTNRELRDCSTKALVRLLENRIDVLIEILILFHDVNDPYVIERIYCVAYGCTVRTKNTEDLKKLSEEVYKLVFSGNEAFPHILLRDYARGVIEFSLNTGVKFNFDLEIIKPPYKSVWPDELPTKKDLEAMYDRDKYNHLWSSVMGGGDFSRYIIGTNSHHSEWSGCRIGEEPKDRKKDYKAFISLLSKEKQKLFDALDPILTKDNDDAVEINGISLLSKITIGRKSSEEIETSTKTFKMALSPTELTFYEAEIEPYLDHNRNFLDIDKYFDLRLAQSFIFNRVIELGWCPEKHLEFDSKIGSGRGRRESQQERIGKKYQWIAYHEFMARLADNFIRYDEYGKDRKEIPYKGPWDPCLRDIDPTILARSTGKAGSRSEKHWWLNKETFDWKCSLKEWLNDPLLIKNYHGLMQVTDSTGCEWLILESYPKWKEPKTIGRDSWEQPRKEMWCHLNSYLVHDSEYKKFSDWVSSQHFMGRWMPESITRYQMFNREYYWSVANDYFQKDYDGGYGSDWVNVSDKESREIICKVNVTAIQYRWEGEYDHSKEESLNFLKPSSLIASGMKLREAEKDGSLMNELGEVVCFSAEAINDTESHLLVRKNDFVKFLNKNKLKVVWTLLGEKGVIGGSHDHIHRYGRVQFSGAFYLESGEVTGTASIYKK